MERLLKLMRESLLKPRRNNEENNKDEPLETNEVIMEENGKSLNPIVDLNTCDNVVAKEKVKELDLEEMVHPHPCALTCITKKYEVKIAFASLSPNAFKKNKQPSVLCRDDQPMKKMMSSNSTLPLEGMIEKEGERKKSIVILNKVISLLNEFGNDFTNDILLGWLPDNEVHYMINESKLTPHVEENLERG